MQAYFPRSLAARALLACTLGATAARSGGIPVFDGSNFVQNAKTASESAQQTMKQIKQYELQLKQYANMQQNTAAPAHEVWDQATQTMGRLRSTLDTLNQYRQLAGSIDAHLQQFKDVEGHRSTECFHTRCSASQWSQKMQEQGRRGAQAQKSANDALLRGLDQQHQAMQVDARQLERLQAGAKNASGQMQALGAANQFASHLALQLQQIRALLIAQQTAMAARQQVLADREALAEAAQEQALAPRMGMTPHPRNWLATKP
ncbi:P-type conjugative transfer protein TrbJ [Comamonas antarctica]|uniref:P-type conjugative transfer protein TrbJ n=1 Tax=Comamonas antarctica TaxID=2743470 RepID=A0A6N1X6Z5_9BURK|nr:P-type conjugative transfer protein TrbJ [Comamonas antarctica]QKV55131.1 P-type conjugative transfer protein TrbJ [Comamonas antarctica]